MRDILCLVNQSRRGGLWSSSMINGFFQKAVQGIYSVIPYHCGDRQCSADFCKYKEIQRRFMARKAATSIESYTREDVAAEYAEEARFKGKVMDISENGRAAILKVITSKVTVSNISRLAKLMSSNKCENYLNCLIKYSEGKRLYLGQSDSWSVRLHFVAGLKRIHNFRCHCCMSWAALTQTFARYH